MVSYSIVLETKKSLYMFSIADTTALGLMT